MESRIDRQLDLKIVNHVINVKILLRGTWMRRGYKGIKSTRIGWGSGALKTTALWSDTQTSINFKLWIKCVTLTVTGPIHKLCQIKPLNKTQKSAERERKSERGSKHE